MEYGDFEREILGDEKIKEKVERLKGHSYWTYEHSLRMMALCYRFGKHFKFEEDEIKQLMVGGLLHDIGKLWVPSEVLNKNGLTIEDVNLIRKHPFNGFNYVRDLEKRYPLVPGLVGRHHSFSDNPYPIKGDTAYGKIISNQYGENMEFMLIGEEMAKIVSICDAFDALINERPYKKAWGFKDSVNELKRAFGNDAFLRKCIYYVEKNENKKMS